MKLLRYEPISQGVWAAVVTIPLVPGKEMTLDRGFFERHIAMFDRGDDLDKGTIDKMREILAGWPK